MLFSAKAVPVPVPAPVPLQMQVQVPVAPGRRHRCLPGTESSSNSSSVLSSPTTLDPAGSDIDCRSEKSAGPLDSPDQVNLDLGSARPPPAQHSLDIFADRESVENICKAVLHTIFFHRYFAPVKPRKHHLLEVTLPATDNSDIHMLIDQKVAELMSHLDADYLGPGASGGRGQLTVMFFEKRRRETYFFSASDVDVCWEKWSINVTVGTPRTAEEHSKLYSAMKTSFRKTAERIVSIVISESGYIPQTSSTVFPYDILVNPQLEKNGGGMGSLWGFRTGRIGFGRNTDVFAA